MAIATTKTALSLPELHELLKTEFQNPPSLPSLKRWAAAGRLKSAEIHRKLARPSRAKKIDTADASGQHPDQDKAAMARVRYDRHKAIKVIESIWEMTPIDQVKPAAAPAAGQMPGGEEILSMLAELSRQIATQSKAIEAAGAAAAQLNSTRASLMAKYDATNTQQAQIIEGLRRRVIDAENNSSLARDIQSLRLAVAKISEHIFR
jgi:hypothetical protein